MEPIVIIGAGPVGLITALRLSQLGMRSIIIEKNNAIQDELRASTFHPPTIEMLDELGIAKELISIGLKTKHWQFRVHETGEKALFDLGHINKDTKYPFRLQAEQKELCRIATKKAETDKNIDLRMGHQLNNLFQNDELVEISVSVEGQPDYTVKTPLMVAADGGKSKSRDIMGLSFSGKTYPETTILVATEFPFHEYIQELSNVNYVWSDWGTYSLLRLPGIWRCSLYPDIGETIDQATTPESINEKLSRIVPDQKDFRIVEVRPYKIHQRILDTYVHGRVVFAGDAAHLNSPSGGMGMNGGIHDGWCLSESLKDIFLGGLPLTRLGLYGDQRQKIAENEILKNADKNRSRMQERDKNHREAELVRLKKIASDPKRAREFLMKSSMIKGLKEAEGYTH
jgi:3-(3-hydroxy-phenyl)propionate hydroxylase